jgi:zona occludens toxin (predicted ATPase)
MKRKKMKNNNVNVCPHFKEITKHLVVRNYFKVANEKCKQENTKNMKDLWILGKSVLLLKCLLLSFILFYISWKYHHPLNTHKTRGKT